MAPMVSRRLGVAVAVLGGFLVIILNPYNLLNPIKSLILVCNWRK